MIRPVHFAFNVQTADSNHFQQQDAEQKSVQAMALAEFDHFVGVLQENEIHVTVVEDTPLPHTPDSIFPNNWISFHENGQVFLYPMQAENRRQERRTDIIRQLSPDADIIDLSAYEQENRFLEGTGSLVLDREHQLAFACLSPRTDAGLVEIFSSKSGYRAVLFDAVDAAGKPIYHTNVLMSIGDAYAVICLDAIRNDLEKEAVRATLEAVGKTVIPISFGQMEHFAGNMLQLENDRGEKLLVLSEAAFSSLLPEQISVLEKQNRLIPVPIPVIEKNGGGSVRCMLAEVFVS